MNARLGVWILGGLLAVSVGVHLAQALGPGPETSQPLTATSASTTPPASSAPPMDAEICELRLQACHEKSWRIVSEAFTQVDEAAERDGSVPSRDDVDDASWEQREMLNRIAREHLQEHWLEDQEAIVTMLAPVGEEAWTADWIEQRLTQMKDVTELDEETQKELQQAYEELWKKHGAKLNKSIADEDFGGLLEASKTFFAAEDEMLADHLDDKELSGVKAQQLRSRTAVLAIAATLAGAPWDDELNWMNHKQ